MESSDPSLISLPSQLAKVSLKPSYAQIPVPGQMADGERMLGASHRTKKNPVTGECEESWYLAITPASLVEIEVMTTALWPTIELHTACYTQETPISYCSTHNRTGETTELLGLRTTTWSGNFVPKLWLPRCLGYVVKPPQNYFLERHIRASRLGLTHGISQED